MITFKPLRRTLVEMGITKQELARRMGLGYPGLLRILHGDVVAYGDKYKEEVNVRNVEKICKALGCEMKDVIRND